MHAAGGPTLNQNSHNDWTEERGPVNDDDFVNSTDEDYIKEQIREKHLRTTSVTIVIAGECTWSRKFVDWEIASSLRNDPKNKRSGLLVITVPDKTSAHLPDRVSDNWVEGDAAKSFALFKLYPTTEDQLRRYIETVFVARVDKADLVDNSRRLRQLDTSCP